MDGFKCKKRLRFNIWYVFFFIGFYRIPALYCSGCQSCFSATFSLVSFEQCGTFFLSKTHRPRKLFLPHTEFISPLCQLKNKYEFLTSPEGLSALEKSIFQQKGKSATRQSSRLRKILVMTQFVPLVSKKAVKAPSIFRLKFNLRFPLDLNVTWAFSLCHGQLVFITAV